MATAPLNPAGPSEPIRVTSSTEHWSEYKLEDGSIVRIKTILVSVSKMKGQYNEAGEPIYGIKTTQIVDAIVPDKLKKKK